MQSKIIASVPAYNDPLFLDYVMRSLNPFVDEIIITDSAFKVAQEMGWSSTSTGEARKIVDRWVDNKRIFIAPRPQVPVTGVELSLPALQMAKEHGCDWYFTVGADEIWSVDALKFLRSYLQICDKKGVLGLNVWMYMFAPDMWHYREFRNPRLARLTPDAMLCPQSGDSVMWPKLDLYQYAGDCELFAPADTPQKVLDVNRDFPKNFKVFHYSCVGAERVKNKVEYYNRLNGTFGDRYCEAYTKKNWESFRLFGFKEYKGTHPDIMLNHPLINDRLY